MIKNPAFGWWSSDDVVRLPERDPAFAPRDPGGKWCEKCRKDGIYSWLRAKGKINGKYEFYPCPRCSR